MNYINPITGHRKEAPEGFSWTIFCFSYLVPIIRGDFKWGFIYFLIGNSVWGISGYLYFLGVGLQTLYKLGLGPDEGGGYIFVGGLISVVYGAIVGNIYNSQYEETLREKGYITEDNYLKKDNSIESFEAKTSFTVNTKVETNELKERDFNEILSSEELKNIFRDIEKLNNKDFQNEFIYVLKKVIDRFKGEFQDKVDAVIILRYIEKFNISSRSFFEIKNKEYYSELLEKINKISLEIGELEKMKIMSIEKLYLNSFILLNSNINCSVSEEVELLDKISLDRILEINYKYPNITLSENEKFVIGENLVDFIDTYVEQYNNKMKLEALEDIEKMNRETTERFEKTNRKLEIYKRNLNIKLFSVSEIIHNEEKFKYELVLVNEVREYIAEQKKIREKKEQEKKTDKKIFVALGAILLVVLIYIGWSFSA